MIKGFIFLGFMLMTYFTGMDMLTNSVEITKDTQVMLDKSIVEKVDYETRESIFTENDIVNIIANNVGCKVVVGGKEYSQGSILDFLIDNKDDQGKLYSYRIIVNNGEMVINFD